MRIRTYVLAASLSTQKEWIKCPVLLHAYDATGKLLLRQSVCHGVMHQLAGSFQVELFEDASPIGIHSMYA